MTIDRRGFLAATSAAAAFLLFPGTVAGAAGDRVIELKAMPADGRLAGPDGPVSSLWTYNGVCPGPEIRVRQGDRVRVRLVNALEEPTSIHWHGIRIDNAMDGVAGLTQEAVPPGGTFDYDFVVPDAGTYWYHAHTRSWSQVGRGLYGALIVEEPEPVYPRASDLVLVLDDWRLTREGVLETASFGSLMDWSHGGRLGNHATVNGDNRPVLALARGEPSRLRLINVCNSRILALDPARLGARILAWDGQPLGEAVVPGGGPLPLGPGQRVDLLVIPRDDFMLDEVSGDQPFPLAEFRVRGEAVSGTGTMPAPLPPNTLPEPDLAGAEVIKVDMRGGAMGGPVSITHKGKVLDGEDYRRTGQVWALNGVANAMDKPIASVKRGETVIIETANNTAFDHAMHTHGHHFRVISVNGSGMDGRQPWRDTFLVAPGQTVSIAFVADNPGKWLYHCHMLEHAAAGMTCWFEVTS